MDRIKTVYTASIDREHSFRTEDPSVAEELSLDGHVVTAQTAKDISDFE